MNNEWEKLFAWLPVEVDGEMYFMRYYEQRKTENGYETRPWVYKSIVG